APSLPWPLRGLLDVLCSKCKVQFSSDLKANDLEELPSDKQLESFTKVVLREETPLDIRAKLIITLIHLRASHLVRDDDLSKEVLEASVEDFGDLILEVMEAYMNMQEYQAAIRMRKS
ncbi:Uncharacterized protein FKW44_024307, partial [Caligus rogercresseyi]